MKMLVGGAGQVKLTKDGGVLLNECEAKYVPQFELPYRNVSRYIGEVQQSWDRINPKDKIDIVNNLVENLPQLRDFLFKDIGFEVKFTSAKKPTLNISSELQLDSQNLSKLYLILYATEKVNDKGFSLNSLIEDVRLNLKNNQISLNTFNEILNKIGYFDTDSENYTNLYKLKNRFIFIVNDEFPKIIASDLKTGIFNTTYSIDLSSIEKYIVSPESLSILLN